MGDLSLLEAAVRFAQAKVAIYETTTHALDRVLEKVDQTAKSEIGEYQEAAGPFPAWAQLAESTQKERERLGFTPNDPLLRSGELRDSIGHSRAGLEGEVGSTSDVAVYQELGTSRIPPRPFLGPAAERNHDFMMRQIGKALVAGIMGERPIGGDYDLSGGE